MAIERQRSCISLWSGIRRQVFPSTSYFWTPAAVISIQCSSHILSQCLLLSKILHSVWIFCKIKSIVLWSELFQCNTLKLTKLSFYSNVILTLNLSILSDSLSSYAFLYVGQITYCFQDFGTNRQMLQLTLYVMTLRCLPLWFIILFPFLREMIKNRIYKRNFI